MSPEQVHDQVEAVGVLNAKLRRTIYFYVASQAGEVSRDQTAEAVHISRVLAAFHLDRLVAAGLLETSYRQLSGRRGYGVGRPAKLYRRSRRQVEISLPPRRYDLAAELFARSLERAADGPAKQALALTAREFGSALGDQARRKAGPNPGRERLFEAAQTLLADFGFEPYREDGVIRLRNCPFDALAREHRDLVCGTNLDLMEGFLAGLKDRHLCARLEPQPNRCCVVLAEPGHSTVSNRDSSSGRDSVGWQGELG